MTSRGVGVASHGNDWHLCCLLAVVCPVWVDHPQGGSGAVLMAVTPASAAGLAASQRRGERAHWLAGGAAAVGRITLPSVAAEQDPAIEVAYVKRHWCAIPPRDGSWFPTSICVGNTFVLS